MTRTFRGETFDDCVERETPDAEERGAFVMVLRLPGGNRSDTYTMGADVVHGRWVIEGPSGVFMADAPDYEAALAVARGHLADCWARECDDEPVRAVRIDLPVYFTTQDAFPFRDLAEEARIALDNARPLLALALRNAGADLDDDFASLDVIPWDMEG